VGDAGRRKVAIVDYGMGNLFSVKHACEHVGLGAAITSSWRDVLEADAVVMPGVGAFGTAMETLRKLDMVDPLRQVAASLKPFVGVCLGMQLLMTESLEFGRHPGLGVIEGTVVRLENPVGPDGVQKVPQVCWNRLFPPAGTTGAWSDTLLDGLPAGAFMYFCHSFYAKPSDPRVVLATTRYGEQEFCSALRSRNIFACQCHPERSGLAGLTVYRNLARMLDD